MTLKAQISSILNELDSDVINELFAGEISATPSKWGESGEVYEFRSKLEEHSIKLELEAHHGGEGEGDSFWSVYSFAQGGDKVYVQFDGWYASYNGSEFDSHFFVEPKQVMVTQYDKVS